MKTSIFFVLIIAIALLTGSKIETKSYIKNISENSILYNNFNVKNQRELTIDSDQISIIGFAENKLVYYVGKDNIFSVYIKDCATNTTKKLGIIEAQISSGSSVILKDNFVYFDMGFVDQNMKLASSKLYEVDIAKNNLTMVKQLDTTSAITRFSPLSDNEFLMFDNCEVNDEIFITSLNVFNKESNTSRIIKKYELNNDTITGEWLAFATTHNDVIYALIQESKNRISTYKIEKYDLDGKNIGNYQLTSIQENFKDPQHYGYYKSIIDFIVVDNEIFLISDLSLNSIVFQQLSNNNQKILYEGLRLFSMPSINGNYLLYEDSSDESKNNYCLSGSGLYKIHSDTSQLVIGYWNDNNGNTVTQIRDYPKQRNSDKYYISIK